MAQQQVRSADPNFVQLWFGLLGGAVAWTLHLMLAYMLGEFGCVAGWDRADFLGISAVAWGVLGLTLLTGGAAAAATYLSYRSEQRLRGRTPVPWAAVDPEDPAAWMARAGWITSGVFLFVILMETIPIFYYLRDC